MGKIYTFVLLLACVSLLTAINIFHGFSLATISSRSTNTTINNNNEAPPSSETTRIESNDQTSVPKDTISESDFAPKDKKPRPLPVQIFSRYKQWHSQTTLNQEEEELNQHQVGRSSFKSRNQRTFLVGYYTCPHSAGNRLHEFWNSLLYAIVSN